ncbi:MAG: ABC transporter permease subunit [Proteobacteria bacterium]|nr:ABC transporter permease subunit [Pseudomonadota bacterium]
MIRRAIDKKKSLMIGVLSILVLMGFYSLVSHWQHQKNPDDSTIPTWTQLGQGVQKIIEVNPRSDERWIVVDSKATMSRLFLGLFFGVAGAVVIGLLMGCFTPFEAFLAPPMSLLAKVPPTAALAVFFVLAGTDTRMYVAMISFGVLPTLAQSIYLAVKEVPDETLYKAYTLGASQTELIWNIILRHIMPKMLDAVRLQIGPAMVYLIAAEMVVGDVGFGYRIRLQSRLLNMNVVYPYLAVLAAFGFFMDVLLRRTQHIFFRWYTHGKR